VRWTLLILLAAAGCAETTAPLPPPEELLLVANAGTQTLSYVSLRENGPRFLIQLGYEVREDARPFAGRKYAAVAVANGDSLVIVDLLGRVVAHAISVGEGAGALGGAVLNDSVAYVALSNRNLLLKVNLETGDTLGIPVGSNPADVVVARGKLFVVNANLTDCPAPDLRCPAGESWLTVIDPITNAPSAPDSIALPGPGHASYAAVGADGRVYVMQLGGPESPEGRLSIVDPLNRSEVGNFGGFGTSPGAIAADLGERVMVASRTEGLMEFNTRTRTVVRGAGSGLPLTANTGVAIDSHGQIYGIEAGACAVATTGRARVFRPDLTEEQPIPLGNCAGGATTTLIPVETLLEALN
jgi:DNA-binding beta-propeller fold protein YncE